MELFERVRREQEEERKVKEARKKAERMLKDFEKELKKRGDRTILRIPADKDEFRLAYDLRVALGGSPEEFESKVVSIYISPHGDLNFKYNVPVNHGDGLILGEENDLEQSMEYQLLERLPRMQAEELGQAAPNSDVTPEEKLRLAGDLAKHVPDGRFNSRYD